MISSNFSSFKDVSKNIIILLLFVALIFLMKIGINFPNNSKFKFKISKFPVPRILILTYIRSGSSFLGDIFQANPRSFYSYEPFRYMTNGSRMPENRIEEALHMIKHIFKCEFRPLNKYIKYINLKKSLLIRNHYFWNVCDKIKMCSNTDFIEKTCNRSKLQLMKVTRLHMKYLDTLLPDMSGSNFHIIYLVRDPRGIINSRRKLYWGSDQATNLNLSKLCSEIREDLYYFRKFQKKYPQKFTLVKFEDLSKDPISNSKAIYEKIGIPFDQNVQQFLNESTNISSNDIRNIYPFATARNSSKIADAWVNSLNISVIIEAQTNCGDVLRKLNYKLI